VTSSQFDQLEPKIDGASRAMLSDLAVDAEQGLRPCSRNPSSEMIDGLRRCILAGPCAGAFSPAGGGWTRAFRGASRHPNFSWGSNLLGKMEKNVVDLA
jgi:hypothetical protein